MEKEAKVYEKSLRSQKKIEEASRIRAVIREFAEELKEGWKVSGLDAYVRYFCKDTVSFFDYFKEWISDGRGIVFLDEPLRLREKGETVETEFRESMIQRLEKGYLLPSQTEVLYPAKEILARIQTCLLYTSRCV